MNVGGLFSDELAQAPWSLAKVWDLVKHLPLPAVDPGARGDRAAHPHHAREPARRAAQAVRRHGPRARALGAAGRSQISGARGAESVREHHRLPAARTSSPAASSCRSCSACRPWARCCCARSSPRTCSSPAPSCCCSACMTVVGTFISDLLLMWIDPRIRLEGPMTIARPGPREASAPTPAHRRRTGLRRHAVAAHVVALPPAPAGHGGPVIVAALLPVVLFAVPGLRRPVRLRGAALARSPAADSLVRRRAFAPLTCYGLDRQARPA